MWLAHTTREPLFSVPAGFARFVASLVNTFTNWKQPGPGMKKFDSPRIFFLILPFFFQFDNVSETNFFHKF